jgi:hypothetical protein
VLAKEMPETKIVVCEPEDAPLLGSGIKQERKSDGSPAAAHPANVFAHGARHHANLPLRRHDAVPGAQWQPPSAIAGGH